MAPLAPRHDGHFLRGFCSTVLKQPDFPRPIHLPYKRPMLYSLLDINAGIHKMLDRIAKREDPGQTASSEAV